MEFKAELNEFDRSMDSMDTGSSTEAQSVKTDLRDKTKPLIRKRGTQKSLITRILNKLLDSPEDSDCDFIQQQCTDIADKLKIIRNVDAEILEGYESLAPVYDSIGRLYENEMGSHQLSRLFKGF